MIALYNSRHFRPALSAPESRGGHEALTLLKRQAELESAIKQPGDIRITEEQELHIVRQRLEKFPEAMRAALQAAHALRRPITEVSTDEVERWAATRAFR